MSAPSKPPVAVALRYDAPSAPKVVAVGRGELGQRIVEVARENGVPIERNAALAEALSSIPLDDQIPERLYEAVAVVLAFILRAAATAQPADRPAHR